MPINDTVNTHLLKAQQSLQDAMAEMSRDIGQVEERLALVEDENNKALKRINELQSTVEKLRDSAIRGEVASGQKTKDVAAKFGVTPARVSQIAPRRRYNNG